MTKQPTFFKGLVLAFATLAVSTWALGSLWLSNAAADDAADNAAHAHQRADVPQGL